MTIQTILSTGPAHGRDGNESGLRQLIPFTLAGAIRRLAGATDEEPHLYSCDVA